MRELSEELTGIQADRVACASWVSATSSASSSASRGTRSIPTASPSSRSATPSYDDWDVVRDFDDLETARAWRQQLTDAGHEAVITSDHPLNEYGRGDIALRVPPGKWSEANEALDEP